MLGNMKIAILAAGLCGSLTVAPVALNPYFNCYYQSGDTYIVPGVDYGMYGTKECPVGATGPTLGVYNTTLKPLDGPVAPQLRTIVRCHDSVDLTYNGVVTTFNKLATKPGCFIDRLDVCVREDEARFACVASTVTGFEEYTLRPMWKSEKLPANKLVPWFSAYSGIKEDLVSKYVAVDSEGNQLDRVVFKLESGGEGLPLVIASLKGLKAFPTDPDRFLIGSISSSGACLVKYDAIRYGKRAMNGYGVVSTPASPYPAYVNPFKNCHYKSEIGGKTMYLVPGYPREGLYGTDLCPSCGSLKLALYREPVERYVLKPIDGAPPRLSCPASFQVEYNGATVTFSKLATPPTCFIGYVTGSALTEDSASTCPDVAVTGDVNYTLKPIMPTEKVSSEIVSRVDPVYNGTEPDLVSRYVAVDANGRQLDRVVYGGPVKYKGLPIVMGSINGLRIDPAHPDNLLPGVFSLKTDRWSSSCLPDKLNVSF